MTAAKNRDRKSLRARGSAERVWVWAALVAVVGLLTLWVFYAAQNRDEKQRQDPSAGKPLVAGAAPSAAVPCPDVVNTGAAQTVQPTAQEQAPETHDENAAQDASEPAAPKRTPRPPSPGSLPTASDQILAMLTDAAGGIDGPPPPVNAVSDEEFRASLSQPIEILETDDPRTRQMKEDVMRLRDEVLALLDAGMSVNEIIRQHREEAEHLSALRHEAVTELIEIEKSGDIEGACTYREAVNEMLRDAGAPEITKPVTEDEYRELEERNAYDEN